MPPRHGKSEFASKYFPAWYLGTFPDRRVILTSYEADFAMTWGRKVRDILQEFGPALFGVGVRHDSTAAHRWSIDGRQGGMDTAGVGGPMTGKGAHLLVIDDPIKNAEEANSQTYRDKTWEWYTSTAYTRLEPGGSVVLIQTRWHEDDLAGRLLQHQTGERWEHINLPALAEDGDALGRAPGQPLWPARFALPALQGIRATLGSYWWSALYQQRPTPAEGGTFKRSWFRYWEMAGDGLIRLLGPRPAVIRLADTRRFGIVDLAFSVRREADYTVIGAFAVTPRSDLILLDLHRDRMEGPDILPAARRMMERHGLEYFGIEAQGAQLAIVQEAWNRGMAVRPLKAETDKITRAIVATVRMEAGQIYFPQQSPWLGDLEAELLSFPKGTHDDQVDCLSYAALEVQRFGGASQPKDPEAELELAAARHEAHLSIDNELWWNG